MDGFQLKNVSEFLINPNDYEIIKMIGNGSYGAVYLAKNKKDGALYSMKYIQCQMMNHIQKQYLTREIEIMAKATHPALLSLRGYSLPSSENNSPVATIITDYMPKGSLFQMIQQEQQHMAPPNYNNTTKNIIIIGIAAGMKYLHSKNIMHRDLKPENILLNDALEPHIGDFGLSKLLDNSNSNGQANTLSIGTPLYMAPEIFTNSPYDFKVDVYAFGMILYEVLTSESPFKEITNPMALGMKICNGERPLYPPNFSPIFQVLIDRCWASIPDHRPTFDEIVEYLNNPQVLVEGADANKVREYCQKVIVQFQDHSQKDSSQEAKEKDDYKRLLKIIKKNAQTIDSLKRKFQRATNQFNEETKKMQEEISELKKEDSKVLSEFRLTFQNNQDNLKKLTEEHKNLMQEVQKLKREMQQPQQLRQQQQPQQQPQQLRQQQIQNPVHNMYQYPPNSIGSSNDLNLIPGSPNPGMSMNQINSTPISANYRRTIGSIPNMAQNSAPNLTANQNQNQPQNLSQRSNSNYNIKPNLNLNANSPGYQAYNNSTPNYFVGSQPRT